MSDVRYGAGVKIGDIVKMELNTKDKTMQFYQNEHDHGIAFRDIEFHQDITYYLAIYLESGSDIEIIDFACYQA